MPNAFFHFFFKILSAVLLERSKRALYINQFARQRNSKRSFAHSLAASISLFPLFCVFFILSTNLRKWVLWNFAANGQFCTYTFSFIIYLFFFLECKIIIIIIIWYLWISATTFCTQKKTRIKRSSFMLAATAITRQLLFFICSLIFSSFLF